MPILRWIEDRHSKTHKKLPSRLRGNKETTEAKARNAKGVLDGGMQFQDHQNGRPFARKTRAEQRHGTVQSQGKNHPINTKIKVEKTSKRVVVTQKLRGHYKINQSFFNFPTYYSSLKIKYKELIQNQLALLVYKLHPVYYEYMKIWKKKLFQHHPPPKKKKKKKKKIRL